jgi:hypothetical protein
MKTTKFKALITLFILTVSFNSYAQQNQKVPPGGHERGGEEIKTGIYKMI